MNNALFEKNLQALEKTNTDLYEQVTAHLKSQGGSPEERCKLVSSKNGEKNLLLKHGETFHPIHDMDDPASEARELYEKTKTHSPRILIVLGLGMGHLLDFVLKHLPTTTQTVLVVEQSMDVFIKAMEHLDLSMLFNEPKIRFLVDLREENAQTRLLDYLGSFTTLLKDAEFIALTSSLSHFKKRYDLVIATFFTARSLMIFKGGNSVEDSFDGFVNVMHNMDILSSAVPLADIKNLFQKTPGIVVSAGPSLNKNMHHLKKISDNAVIIAVDSCLRPLLAAGIRPHLTVAIERGEIVATLFQNLPPVNDIFLVAPSLLVPAVFQEFGGPVFLYTPGHGYAQPLPFKQSYFHITAGPSAGNLAYATAAYLGCDPIIICGQDLSFDTTTFQSHVNGTVDPEREKARTLDEIKQISMTRTGAPAYEIKGYDGGTVWTDVFWEQFLRELENQILESRVATINSTEGGAFIAGAKNMPLEAALDQSLPPHPLQIRKHLLDAHRPSSLNQKIDYLNQMTDLLSTSIRILTDTAEQCAQMHQKINDNLAWVQQLEEKGTPCKLSRLNTFLTEFLELKNDLTFRSTEKAHLFLKGVTSAYYYSFERDLTHLVSEHTDDYSLKKAAIFHHRNYFKFLQKWTTKIIDVLRETEKLTAELIAKESKRLKDSSE